METSRNMQSDSLPRNQSKVSLAFKNVRKKLRLTDEGATPTNWKVVFLVFMSLFTSSFNICFLFPFLPEMILTFGYKEEDKGYYAGIVASALFIGRACGSYFWGWLSDIKGRKPVMLITILLNGVFSLAFGFTTNIYIAFITRFLSGLANGTVGTAKTVLYEISDDTNQAVGMSIISVAWGSGIIIGPAVGGYLANPCKRYPNTFPSEGFLYDFPYIFPGLFAFVIALIAFVVDFILLPETLNMNRIDPDDVVIGEDITDERISLHSSNGNMLTLSPNLAYLTDKPRLAISVENLHLESEGATFLAGSRKEIHISRHGITFPDVDSDNKGKSKPVLERALSDTGAHSCSHCKGYSCNCTELKEVKQTLLTDKHDTNGDMKHETPVNKEMIEVETQKKDTSCCEGFRNWSIFKLIRQYDVFVAVGLYSLFSFSVIGTEEVFTVWASTDILLDGLGFQPNEIGTVLGSTSVPLLFLQLFVFPNMVRRLGIKRSLVVCGILLMVFTQAISTLHIFVHQPVVLWTLLLILNMVMKLMVSCVFSCTGLFINNSVTPDLAGSVNGLSMTTCAAFRSLAPIVGGSIYSWTVGYASKEFGPPFDVSFVFFFFGVVYFFVIIFGAMSPDSLNKQKK